MNDTKPAVPFGKLINNTPLYLQNAFEKAYEVPEGTVQQTLEAHTALFKKESRFNSWKPFIILGPFVLMSAIGMLFAAHTQSMAAWVTLGINVIYVLGSISYCLAKEVDISNLKRQYETFLAKYIEKVSYLVSEVEFTQPMFAAEVIRSRVVGLMVMLVEAEVLITHIRGTRVSNQELHTIIGNLLSNKKFFDELFAVLKYLKLTDPITQKPYEIDRIHRDAEEIYNAKPQPQV